MSFNDRAQNWFEEFRAEVISDHRQLLACREQRKAKNNWSFEHALKRTQDFYDERFKGYHKVGSINANELKQLLDLVERLGQENFDKGL
ncbi:MAG: hypothetical protein OQK24_13695 [Magnetovibrio sp.]|nr:hypothetical protein [Magnetovibrio sp.]